MLITSHQQVQELRNQILESMEIARSAVVANTGHSLGWLTELRFGQLGIHPLEGHLDPQFVIEIVGELAGFVEV